MRLSCESTSRVPCADNNQMLIAATYVLHMLSFPAGWSTPAPDDAGARTGNGLCSRLLRRRCRR